MALDERYPLALPQGTILAGQYVIGHVLGQGGFGITYKATDHKTGQSVAVKEFFPDSMASRTTQTLVTAFPGERGESFAYGKGCFLQEAETLAEFIGNENIVRVYSYFEENGTAYFVMEFIEGTSFEEYIKGQGGKVPYGEAERILLPVIDALALVHAKGIVHRDVTPDNIYITNDGRVKLLDFGAARYSLGDKSRSLDVVLKHGFAPKEQYTRHGRQGAYTDVYTVGATFYFAVTGRRPPDSIDRMEEDDLIPPGNLGVKIASHKEEAILKAMSVQPSNRYQTMGEFRKALMGEGETGTQAQGASMQAQGAMPQPQVQQRVFTAPQPTPAPQPMPQPVPMPQPTPMQSQPMPQPVSMPQPTPAQSQPMPQPMPVQPISAKGKEQKKKKWFVPAVSGAAILLTVVSVAAALSGGRDRTPIDVEPSQSTFSDTVVDEKEISSQSYIDTTETTEEALARLAGSSSARSSDEPSSDAVQSPDGIYSDENGYGEGRIGDAMHTHFFDYTVNDAYLCGREYEGYEPAEDGWEFLVADVTVKNTFRSSITMYDTDFQIQWNDDADDAFGLPITHYLDGETLNDQMLPGDYDLATNETVNGLLVFLVPSGNRDFSISYLEMFDDDTTGDVFFVYFSADRR